MTMSEVVGFVDGYARHVAAPVHTNTTVTSVQPADDGYLVVTDQGQWRCPTVVLATGSCNIPKVPTLAASVPAAVAMSTPIEYRNPGQLDDGGVLVVGASATGIQLADEIHRSGRPVTLAVGEHVRLPRVYRGKDIQWWMAVTGLLDERYDQVDNLTRVRTPPVVPARRNPGADDARSERPRRAWASSSSGGSPASTTATRSSPGPYAISAPWPI